MENIYPRRAGGCFGREELIGEEVGLAQNLGVRRPFQ